MPHPRAPSAAGALLAQLLGLTAEAQLSLLSLAMLALAGPTLLALTCGRLAAPYGKYSSGATARFFGPAIDGRLAWLLQEAPSLLLPAFLWWRGAAIDREAALLRVGRSTVLLALFLLHYSNRSLIYPLRIRGGKATPVGIMLMALSFCLANGYLQGRSLVLAAAAAPPEVEADILEPRFVLGVALFFAGLGINLHADAVLRSLRGPGEIGYKVPNGGAFDYVSGANFLGEIIEWTGFAIASWSLPALAFAVFTAANIGPRALQHHEWYLRTFARGKGYPASRRALVPFVL